MCFCLETPRDFYKKGPLTLVKGLIILGNYRHICVQPFESFFLWEWILLNLILSLDSSGGTFHSSSRFHGGTFNFLGSQFIKVHNFSWLSVSHIFQFLTFINFSQFSIFQGSQFLMILNFSRSQFLKVIMILKFQWFSNSHGSLFF